MRASLVSATSIAAVLALEAGPTMAGPVFDLSTSGTTPSSCVNSPATSCTLTFYALPGGSSGQTLTGTADVRINGTLTFPTAPPPVGFTGTGNSNSGTMQPNATLTATYTYTGGSSAGVTGQSTTATGSILVAASKGNGANGNAAQSSTVTFTGVTVAPVQSVSSVLQVYARGGSGSAGSAAATVTVSNVGKGDLAPTPTNLNGKIGPISDISGNWTGPAVTSFSIQDSTTAGPTSQAFTYTYTPASTRGSSSTGTLSVAFTNGNSSGSNASQTVPVSLTGSTVGPVYQSSLNSTVNTPGKNNTPPTSTIDYGTVAKNTTHTEMLTLTNISTDKNGGNANLTNLSIESFNITGTNASNFSIAGKQSGTGGVAAVLPENGGSETINIDFSAASTGTYDAILQLNTDVDAAFGGPGAFYQYLLTAFVSTHAPEPGTALLLSVGLGGLLLLRRRQPRH